MSTTPSVWQRIPARAALGIWRQKKTLLFSGVVVGAMLGYMQFAPALSLGGSPGQAGGDDCADTVMAAVLGTGTPAVQQQAYQCMDSAFQQRVSQQEFASQFRSSTDAPVSKVSRLGTYDGQSGAELVYYAVDSGQQSVAFVVYLNPDGKVSMID